MPLRVIIVAREASLKSIAERLYQRIADKFGAAQVALGAESLSEPGESLSEAIEQRIRSSDALIVLIGTQWLEGDWVNKKRDPERIALLAAIESKKRILPLLVDGASLPDEEQLPEALHPLLDRAGVPIRSESLDATLNDIESTLEKIIKPPASVGTPPQDLGPVRPVAPTPTAQSELAPPLPPRPTYSLSPAEGAALRMAFARGGYRQPNTRVSRDLEALMQELKFRPIKGNEEALILHVGVGKNIGAGNLAGIMLANVEKKANGKVVWRTNAGEAFITNQRMIIVNAVGGVMRKRELHGWIADFANLTHFEPFEYRDYTTLVLHSPTMSLSFNLSFPMSGAAGLATMANAMTAMNSSTQLQNSKNVLDYAKAQQQSKAAQQSQDQVNAGYSAQATNFKKGIFMLVAALCGVN
jgi:hypothetical protein